MRGKVKTGLLLVNILLILCTLAAFASPFIHPARNGIPGTLALFLPVLFFGNLFMALMWIAMGKWYGVLSLACLVTGYARINNFIQLGIHTRAEDAAVLRIATYNIYSFHRMSLGSATPEEMLLRVLGELGDPAIVCVQEAVNIGRDNTRVGQYQYLYAIPNSGTLLLSTYPIVRSGHLRSARFTSLSGWADIVAQGDTIRVYALHLNSNRITEESEQLIGGGKLQERRAWIAAGELLRKYHEASAIRADQALEIGAHISSSPYPVLVMGDFNDIPQSYAYQTLRGRRLQDSFVTGGTGIGKTYAGSIPGLRIDYILADTAFRITAHETPKLPHSDHYPVVAEVAVRSR